MTARQFFDTPVPCFPILLRRAFGHDVPKMFQMEHSAQNGLNLTIDNQQLKRKTGLENLKPKSWHHFGTKI